VRLRGHSRLFKALAGGGVRDLVTCAADADERYCDWIKVRTNFDQGRLYRAITFSTRRIQRRYRPFLYIGEFAR
jgi:hypothetical protein